MAFSSDLESRCYANSASREAPVDAAKVLDIRASILTIGSVVAEQNKKRKDSTIDAGDEKKGLLGGLNLLLKEQEPTMVVIPDAVHLPDEPSCIQVQQAMVQHCGEKRQSRVEILEISTVRKTARTPRAIASRLSAKTWESIN